ncbi:MAG: phosphate/phosphite/phosphonate ABC transporter substrate-binding protein [Candidatus Electrothrix sp. YB6]
MCNRIPTVIAAVIFVFAACFCQAGEQGEKEQEITIGVLAANGKLNALKQWNTTAEYLTASLDVPFSIVPLEFGEVLPAVEKDEVDFFIANPFLFVTAKVRYAAVPVATMQSSGQDSFGGVIFTAANTDIIDLTDLKGRKFGAVQKNSLGGWQMAQKEFADAGINALTYFSTLRFFDTHTKVVRAVLSRQVHAGTVRTGVLEKMAENEEIEMLDVKILAQKHYPEFPFVVSTPLYPEWVLARTASTDTYSADKVARYLKYLTKGARAADDAQCTGWSDPLDYSGLEELQKGLKIGAYEEEEEEEPAK